MKKEFKLEIRDDGTILFDRQNEELIEDIRKILHQLSADKDEIDMFLDGRKDIKLILGDEIFCG